MAKLFSTVSVARASARRPWLTIGIWVALVLAAIGAAGTLLSLTSNYDMLNNPESMQAKNVLEDAFPTHGQLTETVIVRSEDLTVDDPAFQQRITELRNAIIGLGPQVATVYDYVSVSQVDPQTAEQMVSGDRHSTVLQVAFVGEFDDLEPMYEDYVSVVKGAREGGYTVYSVGDLTVDQTFIETSESDLAKEILGLPVALIVLVLVFGALTAALVPMILGVVAIIVAVGLTAVISQFTDMSLYAVNMITVFGLAVGIDYALFIIERYREERRRGAGTIGAIEVASGTASRAVLFSGITVVLALLGMLIVPTTIFRSLGLGAILVTIVAVIAMLTLVPAILALLGNRINWPRKGFGTHLGDHEATPMTGFWGTITRVVMRKPVVSVVVASVLLLGLGSFYFRMDIGTAGVESLPPSDVRSGFQLIGRDFSSGAVDPVQIVIEAPRNAETEQRLATLQQGMAADSDFAPPSGLTWSEDGTVALLEVPLTVLPNSEESFDAIERLRTEMIPAAFGGSGVDVYVGGDNAENLDFNGLVDNWTPRVFALVLGLSFVLLVLVFRSIVIPIKAIVMNLLSVGAAYGVIVMIFQEGWGADFFGFTQVPSIEAWVPLLMFSVLFGLSMDYHVFLLSRIREHFDYTKRNRESVAVGLNSTARIITGAAAIMVVVFASFAAGDLVMFQQMGVGLAVAIFLDATIVRSVLVPATMALLGKWNWYLPSWLSWLPNLNVEGVQQPMEPAPAEAPLPAD